MRDRCGDWRCVELSDNRRRIFGTNETPLVRYLIAAGWLKELEMLEIKNLHASIAEDGTEIIRGLNLTVTAGEVAAIMGPNGSGKSTLSYILSGREDYEVTDGDILYNGESILELDAAERASKGIFLAFQYPVEIPGVATMQFLKVAMNEQRKARGEAELTTPDFMRRVKDAAAKLHIDTAMLKRPLNV